jgi:hypothetical protein
VDGLDGLSDAQLIRSALRGDLELVTRYGEEHPGTWAGAWFDNEPTVCIAAAFTSDVAQHDAALRPRLRHQGRLVLRKNGQEKIGPFGSDQPLAGSLLNASHDAGGGYSGGIAGTGPTVGIEPGRSARIKVIFGTASSREELGYVLPPGQYWLKVQMPFGTATARQLTRSPPL